IITKGNRIQFICNFSSKRGKIVAFQRLYLNSYIESYNYDFTSLLITAAVSILIGYEYATIKYFFSNIYLIFRELEPSFPEKQYQIFSHDLKKKLHRSWQFYLTITVVVLPFLALELTDILKYKFFNGSTPPYFYLFEKTFWSFSLDIINTIIQYSLLLFLAVIIWIMIELATILNELDKKYSICINVFDSREIGGLKPLRNFVLSIVSRYFITLTLVIISYESLIESMFSNVMLRHKAIIPCEIIILSLMILIGLIIFLKEQKLISHLIDKNVNYELNEIYRNYKEIYDKILEINSNLNDDENKRELENLNIKMNFFEKKEIRIKEILSKEFDPKTISVFIITTLPSIITLIKEINEIMNQ
ncbi:hypothetical protein, partial [Methanosarcina mazei]